MAEKKTAEKEVKTLSVKDIAKKINKACKDWDILSGGVFSKNLKKLSLGSLGFDLPFKGGLPYGQQVTISGVEHSGKTTVAALAVSQYQQENPDKVCIYVDAENTLLTQADYFQTIMDISYDPEHFLRYDCAGRSAEEIFKDLISLQMGGDIGMIVIDSARALVSQADLDADFEKDNGQRSSIAKPLGKFIKQMTMYLPKRNNILVIINQVTVEKTAFATSYTEPCGYSLKYFPAVKIRLATRTFTCGEKTNYKASELKTINEDGVQLHFAVVKSRIGGIGGSGGSITIRYNQGVDAVYDLLHIAIPAGYISRPSTKSYGLVDLTSGELLQYEGAQLLFNKYEDLENFLRAHLDFVKSYSKMICDYVANSKKSINLLDEETFNSLMEQEEATCPSNMTEAEALAADGVDDE